MAWFDASKFYKVCQVCKSNPQSFFDLQLFWSLLCLLNVRPLLLLLNPGLLLRLSISLLPCCHNLTNALGVLEVILLLRPMLRSHLSLLMMRLRRRWFLYICLCFYYLFNFFLLALRSPVMMNPRASRVPRCKYYPFYNLQNLI